MKEPVTLSHDTVEMANSYKYMVESFANFGVAVGKASIYAEYYLQHGNISAIDSEIVGAKLKQIWTDNADPDFDNFIKNFDVWGATMVAENNLAEDYKEQASATYIPFDGSSGALNTETGEMKNRDDLLKGFGNGHGYVTEDEVRAYRYEHGVSLDNTWNYYSADSWQERHKGSGAVTYFEDFDKLGAEQKAIIARRNSQKAQDIIKTYGRNNTTSAYFHILDNLDPGEMAALTELLETQ